MFGILCKRLQILVVPSRCIAMPSLISHLGFPQIPLFVVNYFSSSLIDDKKKPNPEFLIIIFFFLQPPIPKLTEPKLLSSTVHRLPLHPFTEPRLLSSPPPFLVFGTMLRPPLFCYCGSINLSGLS